MIKNDWLSRYGDIEGLATVFEAMSRKITRENTLVGAEEELEKNYESLEENFIIFFPQLIEYVKNVRLYIKS